MTWQDYYEIAQSLRARSDWLFAQGEHQYASEGIWGALRYASRAVTLWRSSRQPHAGERLSAGTGQWPGRGERPEVAQGVRGAAAQALLQQQPARRPAGGAAQRSHAAAGRSLWRSGRLILANPQPAPALPPSTPATRRYVPPDSAPASSNGNIHPPVPPNRQPPAAASPQSPGGE